MAGSSPVARVLKTTPSFRECGPSAANATPQTSRGFDRGDDPLEVEACPPAGLGDYLRRRGLVGDKARLIAGDKDDPQEARQLSAARELFRRRARPGGGFDDAARARARQVELRE